MTNAAYQHYYTNHGTEKFHGTLNRLNKKKLTQTGTRTQEVGKTIWNTSQLEKKNKLKIIRCWEKETTKHNQKHERKDTW